MRKVPYYPGAPGAERKVGSVIQRFSIVSVLAALAALLLAISPQSAQGASAKRCAKAGKQYQSWTVFGVNRKVGDPKTKLVAKRGTRNLVTVEAPGTPAATGKYHVTITPKKGCEVTKVRVKTRRGFYKLVRISTAGGTISFRATKGDPFPYREVRVWNRKARSGTGSSSRPEPPPSGTGTGSSCKDPYKVSLTGTDEKFGSLSQIRIDLEPLDGDSQIRIRWTLQNGNLLCKYRIYVDGRNIMEATHVDSTGGYLDYTLNGPVRLNQLIVWARRP